MKEKILTKAADMFLNYGFKSVTMDDIAREMGISKKTIYAHYSTKLKLVQAATFFVLDRVNETISTVCSANYDPIKEIFTIKSMVNDQLKNERSSPTYQLQKYYPKIFQQVNDSQFKSVKLCIADNLSRGIREGYYRKEIDIELITRFYFSGIMNLSNREVFPSETFKLPELKDAFIEYHIRAIATEKGLQTLNELLEK